jgi:hypothetical protein
MTILTSSGDMAFSRSCLFAMISSGTLASFSCTSARIVMIKQGSGVSDRFEAFLATRVTQRTTGNSTEREAYLVQQLLQLNSGLLHAPSIRGVNHVYLYDTSHNKQYASGTATQTQNKPEIMLTKASV